MNSEAEQCWPSLYIIFIWFRYDRKCQCGNMHKSTKCIFNMKLVYQKTSLPDFAKAKTSSVVQAYGGSTELKCKVACNAYYIKADTKTITVCVWWVMI